MPHPRTAFFAIDVPLTHKCFDQLDKQISFVGINFDDDVDVLLHVRADVSDFSNGLDCIPGEGIYLRLNCSDLINQTTRLYLPEISNHALEAAA